jgi:hypothetical protein
MDSLAYISQDFSALCCQAKVLGMLHELVDRAVYNSSMRTVLLSKMLPQKANNESELYSRGGLRSILIIQFFNVFGRSIRRYPTAIEPVSSEAPGDFDLEQP